MVVLLLSLRPSLRPSLLLSLLLSLRPSLRPSLLLSLLLSLLQLLVGLLQLPVERGQVGHIFAAKRNSDRSKSSRKQGYLIKIQTKVPFALRPCSQLKTHTTPSQAAPDARAATTSRGWPFACRANALAVRQLQSC
jgi:hypothetical protein